MSKHTIFAHFWDNRWPSPEEIKPFFDAYDPHAWRPDGGDSSEFWLYGAHGTEGQEPYVKRVDIHLLLFDEPGLGVLLAYDKTGSGYAEHFYSKGDPALLSESVESNLGLRLSKGLFIPFADAYAAVEDFLNSDGNRSTRIEWVREEELPRDAMPVAAYLDE